MTYTRNLTVTGQLLVLTLTAPGLFVQYEQDQFNGQGCKMYLRPNFTIPEICSGLCLARVINVCPLDLEVS